MINHPLQRRIKEDTLNARDYIITCKAKLYALKLEYDVYKDRRDIESCIEIQREYRELFIELIGFNKAMKASNEYHKYRGM